MKKDFPFYISHIFCYKGIEHQHNVILEHVEASISNACMVVINSQCPALSTTQPCS